MPLSPVMFGAQRLFQHNVLGNDTWDASRTYAQNMLVKQHVATRIQKIDESGDVLVLTGRDVSPQETEATAEAEQQVVDDWLEFKADFLLDLIESKAREAALEEQQKALGTEENVEDFDDGDDVFYDEDETDAPTESEAEPKDRWEAFWDFMDKEVPPVLLEQAQNIMRLIVADNTYSWNERKDAEKAINSGWADPDELDSNLLASDELTTAEKAFKEAAIAHYRPGIVKDF